MPNPKDTFCSHCGTAYAQPLSYPRLCQNTACSMQVWANPTPVSVLLLPVRHSDRIGLLVIRRALEPRRGRLALVGGFVEEQETWQSAGARELYEEAAVRIDPAHIEPFWFTSTEPRPNRVLLFGVAPPIYSSDISPFVPNSEALERGLIFGPRGLADVFAFPLHAHAAERFFAVHGIDGPHAYGSL